MMCFKFQGIEMFFFPKREGDRNIVPVSQSSLFQIMFNTMHCRGARLLSSDVVRYLFITSFYIVAFSNIHNDLTTGCFTHTEGVLTWMMTDDFFSDSFFLNKQTSRLTCRFVFGPHLVLDVYKLY